MRYLALILIVLIFGCQKSYKFYGTELEEPAYDFQLIDQNGKKVKLSDFKDKIVLLFFGYTNCPDVCPTTMNKLAKLLKYLGKDKDKVKVLFITVDPKRDTPKVLKDYVEFYDKSFVGLWGDLKTIKKVAREYKVFFKYHKKGKSYEVEHTANVYLIKGMVIKLFYTQAKQDPKKIAEDIKHLI